MITHYGLLWNERDVFWGKRNLNGALRGKGGQRWGRADALTKSEITTYDDYREFIGLYCLYSDNSLVYVGEAGIGSKEDGTKSTIYSRLKNHRNGPMAGRWNRFSWFGRQDREGDSKVSTALAQLEAVTIAIINPGFNKQSGTFKGATQIYQVPDARAEGDLETKVNRLLTMVKGWEE